MRAAVATSLLLTLAVPAMAQQAPDPLIAKARSAIAQRLKDPASARFEGIVKRPGAVCGFVNAKNSMGGYVGRQMFVYVIASNTGYLLEVNAPGVMDAIEAAERHCQGVPGF